jgi:hypothetical protein
MGKEDDEDCDSEFDLPSSIGDYIEDEGEFEDEEASCNTTKSGKATKKSLNTPFTKKDL